MYIVKSDIKRAKARSLPNGNDDNQALGQGGFPDRRGCAILGWQVQEIATTTRQARSVEDTIRARPFGDQLLRQNRGSSRSLTA
jgi:hypothetical protein